MSASGIRILGGDLRGRRLVVPAGSRPSSARLREALFSIWAGEVPTARFLDLYAGSGAIALEALSRGAARATLVEKDRSALSALRRNLGLVAPERVRLLSSDSGRALRRLVEEGDRFDLMYADPPYDLDFGAEELAALCAVGATHARIGLERRAGEASPSPPERWELESARSYGDSELHFYRRTA